MNDCMITCLVCLQSLVHSWLIITIITDRTEGLTVTQYLRAAIHGYTEDRHNYNTMHFLKYSDILSCSAKLQLQLGRV